VVRFSRSSDVSGLEACAAKKEVSRREVMAQLIGESEDFVRQAEEVSPEVER
jgi:hypothetical protein